MPNTYRRISKPAPALLVKEFDYYNDALFYSRSTLAGHKPIRSLTPEGIKWKVATVNPEGCKASPSFEKLPAWEKPFPSYCEDEETAGEALARWARQKLASMPSASKGVRLRTLAPRFSHS